MRLLLGSLIGTLMLLLCLPTVGWGSPASAPAPSCAAGPARSGDEIVGTPCADRIVVPASVQYVDAGAGDDTIVALPVTAAVTPACEGVCLGVRSPVYEGGSGSDLVFGERGNDTIRGNGGDDRLFGGIGDDLLEGGEGNDLLAGGFGADSLDGQNGSDYVRGDGTIDHIYDTGASGTDALSYATAVTPGFSPSVDTGAANFRANENSERGVYLDLRTSHPKFNGGNGAAADGGGSDEVEVGAFEMLIGSPFSDYIVGGAENETIYGGGGADVIEGSAGEDHLYGGAGGDNLDGGSGIDSADGGLGSNRCQSIASAVDCPENPIKSVALRGSSQVSLGLMAPSPAPPQIYLVGSSNAEDVTASYSGGVVSFTLAGASFDSESEEESRCSVSGSTANCAVGTIDSIELAGLGGADVLTASGLSQQAGVILLGGEGSDELNGGDGSEDLLVDGRGGVKDISKAGGRDDALIHGGGADELLGGEGNDLFLSTSACDGETINGEEGVDNASWARLEDAAVKNEQRGVDARLGAPGKVGRFGNPGCSGGTPDNLLSIEDLEGSDGADTLVGDAGPNQLLGHGGPDEYFGGFGADILLANSEDSDPVINCGPDVDSAVIDIPTASYADATPIECESVREGKPEDFRTVTELPPPPLVLPPATRPPPPDPKAPKTRVTAHPAKLLSTAGLHRRVVFRFASSEAGSHFRCKLDGKPYHACTSPRTYNVALGKHAVRIFAIDAAGNADRTPALFRFRVRRR